MSSLVRLLVVLCILCSQQIGAEPIFTKAIVVKDDMGTAVRLERPAKRIISLAPHITEILFSLGVGDAIVGTVKYSDFPEKAKQIPRLGDAFSLNVESIMAMQPDIIFAWHTGGVSESVKRLQSLGIPVYVNHSEDLQDISKGFVRMAKLVGEAANGLRLQSRFDQKLNLLAAGLDEGQRPLVFFQISDQSLYTVSDQHIIGKSIRHCGGSNLFPDLQPAVSLVNKEAVIAKSPDIIFVTKSSGESPWFERWNTYLRFQETSQTKVLSIDPSLISRPSFRMLEGLEQICQAISSQYKS